MFLDIIVAITVSLGFYLGYNRGLIKTVFDTLSLVIGVLAALKLSPIVINLIQSVLNTSPALTFLMGVVITFIGVMIIIRFFGRKIEDVFKAININFMNKIAGGTLQAVFFAYLLSLSFYLVDIIKLIKPDVKMASITYSLLEPLPEKGKAVFASLKPMFQTFWSKTLETMDTIEKKAK